MMLPQQLGGSVAAGRERQGSGGHPMGIPPAPASAAAAADQRHRDGLRLWTQFTHFSPLQQQQPPRQVFVSTRLTC